MITGLNLTESAGEPLYWFDVLIDFTFEQGRFPDGTIELYWSRGSQGWVENYVGAVSSNRAADSAREGVQRLRE